jgi:hypothetical protein
MRKTILLALVAILALPAAADARYKTRVGIGDQQAATFDHPGFRALKVKRVRYFIPWNAMRNRDQRLTARRYVLAARKRKIRVFMHISSDNLTRRQAKLPKLRTYRRDVRRLVRYFRKLGVREWGSRNEANHDSQATYKSPRRAAQEFKIVRRACGKRCTVVGLDVLDQPGATRYMQRFYRALGSYRRHAKIVGIHNYSDVNRKRTRGTRAIMRTAKRYNRRTRFWLTETGGVVNFGRNFPYNERRAANRLSYLFRVAKRYRRSIDRVYVYNWTGAPRGARFDAGLTNADGSLRPGYRTFRKAIRRFSR